MWIMTTRAPGRRRLVRMWSLEVTATMTLETELPLGSFEESRVIRSVGVVTRGTGLDLGVAVTRFELQILASVTGEAKLRFFLPQPQGADQTVWQMTRTALTVGDGRVGNLHVGCHISVTSETGAPLLEATSSLELCLGCLLCAADQKHPENGREPASETGMS